MRAAPEPPWTLTYADGAANVYRLTRAPGEDDVRFEYDPVTPERSSTGLYSGGEPRQARLAPGDPRVEEAWRLVAALEADVAGHDERVKGSGAFWIATAAGTRSFVFQQGPALDAVDALMRGLGR